MALPTAGMRRDGHRVGHARRCGVTARSQAARPRDPRVPAGLPPGGRRSHAGRCRHRCRCPV